MLPSLFLQSNVLISSVFVCSLTDPSLPRKTVAAKKTHRRVVLPPAGILNAARYETGLTAQVDGRDHPIVHVTCVLAASIDDSVVSVEPVAYLGA